jgi:lipopolysaccharide transport system ATP-binding protein
MRRLVAPAGAAPFRERHRVSALRLRARGLGVVRCRSRSRAALYALRDTVAELRPPGSRRHGLRPGEFLALDGIDLDLQAGEAVAVLGHNGAGKSTLLKALGGLLAPWQGEIERHGRLETVSELGAGLNPFLTGRENVRLAALLRGTRGAEDPHYLERVRDFAELGPNFDDPVGSYSTGMTARLAFAMAAMARPDVLLVDEALSVGDLAFQRKCARFIQRFIAEGGALVLASHNLVQVQSLCDRAILLAEGRPAFSGATVAAVREMIGRALPAPKAAMAATPGPNAIRLLHFGGADGVPRTGEPARLEVEYRLAEPCPDAIWGFALWTADGEQCVTTAHDLTPLELAAGVGRLTCDTIPLQIESPPSIRSNYQLESRQLVILEVDWQRPS